MSLAALIFDCDGVLAETEGDGHLPCFNATFEEYGLPVRWSVAEYAELVKIGGGKERMATLFDGPLASTLWDGTPEERAMQLTAWHRRKTELYVELIASGAIPGRPGVCALVGEAAAAGVSLAVASTSAEASVRAVLTSAVGSELADRFLVFAGDAAAHKKPAPDIYLLALRELGLRAEDSIVIEDSGIGCQASTAAGIPTVITVSRFTGDDDFAGAALVLPSLEGVRLAELEARVSV